MNPSLPCGASVYSPAVTSGSSSDDPEASGRILFAAALAVGTLLEARAARTAGPLRRRRGALGDRRAEPRRGRNEPAAGSLGDSAGAFGRNADPVSLGPLRDGAGLRPGGVGGPAALRDPRTDRRAPSRARDPARLGPARRPPRGRLRGAVPAARGGLAGRDRRADARDARARRHHLRPQGIRGGHSLRGRRRGRLLRPRVPRERVCRRPLSDPAPPRAGGAAAPVRSRPHETLPRASRFGVRSRRFLPPLRGVSLPARGLRLRARDRLRSVRGRVARGGAPDGFFSRRPHPRALALFLPAARGSRGGLSRAGRGRAGNRFGGDGRRSPSRARHPLGSVLSSSSSSSSRSPGDTASRRFP